MHIDQHSLYIVHHGALVHSTWTSQPEAESALKEADKLGELKYGITLGVRAFAQVIAEEVRQDTAKFLGYD